MKGMYSFIFQSRQMPILRIFLFMFIFSGFFSCKGQVESKSFQVLLHTMLKETVPIMTVDELEKRKEDLPLLLDAREKKEYQVSHLPKAKWVGFEDFELSRLAGVPKDQEIVVYCSIGVRSEKIGEKLQAAGYKNVKNLYGSLFEWVNQGNTVYDQKEKPTPKFMPTIKNGASG